MKRSIFFLAIVIILLTTVYIRFSVERHKLMTLSPELKEVSGLEFDKDGGLWAINDGGNAPELHQLDEGGQVIKSIRVTNGRNRDWEDLTQDDFGHFFIGDFGDNQQDRKDLTVYKIENPADIPGTETMAEIIKFRFVDQDDPEGNQNRNFDLEAFVFYSGRLYLFTKNRTEPFDGFTYLYRMEDYASNQEAQLVSRIKTCVEGKYQCWITSAALSPDREKLALLGSNKIWLFKDWKGDDFFSGTSEEIDLGPMTQKEAITFKNDSTVVLADERFLGIGGNLYAYPLK